MSVPAQGSEVFGDWSGWPAHSGRTSAVSGQTVWLVISESRKITHISIFDLLKSFHVSSVFPTRQIDNTEINKFKC